MPTVTSCIRRGRNYHITFDADGQSVEGKGSVYLDNRDAVLEQAWNEAKTKLNQPTAVDMGKVEGLSPPVPAAKRIVISGPSQIDDMDRLSADDYTATVYDQYGDTMDVGATVTASGDRITAEYGGVTAEKVVHEIVVEEEEGLEAQE